MKAVFFGDIHSNFYAIQAAFFWAQRNSCDSFYCVGDVLGYGPHPNESIEFCAGNQIQMVMGNYDEKVLEAIKNPQLYREKMKKTKWKILEWTISQLNRKSIRYIENLPASIQFVVNKLRVLIVHGSPISNEDAIYPSITARGLKNKLTKLETDILICGHTHIPFVKSFKEMTVINCGSVGQPVDGDSRSGSATIDFNKSPPAYKIVRIAYPIERTIDAIQHTDLPFGLAEDLMEGRKRRESP